MRTGIFGNDDEILEVTTSICRLDDQIKCGDSGHDLEIFVFLDSRQEVFHTHRTIKKEIFDVSLMELGQSAKIIILELKKVIVNLTLVVILCWRETVVILTSIGFFFPKEMTIILTAAPSL